jgi:RNA 3'-terminal phosphate cyclase (ATP)
MIQIDGQQGEGGGQVLRTALAMSIITGQAIQIANVRAKRRNPGLAPQHLAGILAAAQLCDAEIDGAQLRSTQVTFQPGGAAQAGRYAFDISRMAGQGSAGAVTLLLQTILLPLALSDGESELVIRGGTHVAWSPPVHYAQWVLLPTLERIGIKAEIDLETWGWYPQGGGEIRVRIGGGARLREIDLGERGKLTSVKGAAGASNLPAHIPQRISSRANNVLREAKLPARVEPMRTGGPSTGAGLFLAAEYEGLITGFSALGARGKPSEVVADEAVDDLIAAHQYGEGLDAHLPDQLLPALALAEGSSMLKTIEMTQHTRTVIDIIDHFIDRPIRVEGAIGEPGVIRIE